MSESVQNSAIEVKELMNSVKGRNVMMHEMDAPATNGMCVKVKKAHFNACQQLLIGFGMVCSAKLLPSLFFNENNMFR